MNDRLKKKLLCLECALSTLDGYEGWMIGTCALHLDWQAEPGEEKGDCAAYVPEILRKGRSAIRVRIASEEKADPEDAWMEVLLVKPRQGVPVPEKEDAMSVKSDIVQDEDTMAFDCSQMEEYLREAADTNPIHQGKEAVLPGFLVMNECLLRLQKKNWMREKNILEVRFLAPLYPGEKVCLSCLPQENGSTAHLKTISGGREILSIAEK